nr:PAS domain S-box protein [Candidatus Dadabacteria bacterium]NIQ17168.1 PAS domain S-box protein [Candidatus Dadabacteria bacterium]
VIRDKKLAYIPDNVLDLYPGDPDIKLLDPKPLSYMGIPLIDDNGDILGHIAVLDSKPMPESSRNIALMNIFASRALAEIQRLKAEADVREREQKLGRLIDSAMDAILELDENYKITQVNKAAEKIFNIESNNIVGKNFVTFLTKNSVEKLLKLSDEIEDMKEGEKSLWIPDGLDVITANGVEFKAEATISLLALKKNKFYTLILRNVNERIEAERKIKSLSVQAEYLKEEINALHNFEEIIGESKSLLKVIKDVKQVAPTDSSVIIFGETGTGKELIARLIHAQSNRREMPLIKVNCAAIPSNLIESEFFGHEKGAFTGATFKRDGRFTLADGGTIFLDEIGELPFDLQPKLLRVLQEGEFEPVGSSKTVKVNVRVVAATNRNLENEVKNGNFREDLYYRLNVFPITVPPLRERGDDVIKLATSFLNKFANNIGLKLEDLSPEEIHSLKSYDWPGNIRELQNVIERAVITSHGGNLNLLNTIPTTSNSTISDQNDLVMDDIKIYTSNELKKLEKENIIRALEKANWKVSGEDGAAIILGIPPTTLSSQIKALKIKKGS